MLGLSSSLPDLDNLACTPDLAGWLRVVSGTYIGKHERATLNSSRHILQHFASTEDKDRPFTLTIAFELRKFVG